ncbi:hypothetical protein K438DRAFT_2025976 [Mycena galopus ATCC 62051]|nr:hypothetical protein K438DRAFT_2025976 [Mycena galopus ATCC 62051]
MGMADSRVVGGLFSALADTLSLLANLSHLSIGISHWDQSDIPQSSWRTLVRALSTRRLQLCPLAVFSTVPPVDVVAAFSVVSRDSAVYISIDTPEMLEFGDPPDSCWFHCSGEDQSGYRRMIRMTDSELMFSSWVLCWVFKDEAWKV